MEQTSKFSEIASNFRSDTVRGRILAALEASSVTDTVELMDVVHGKSNPEATALLQEWLKLPLPDASALAGVLLASSGIVWQMHYIVVIYSIDSTHRFCFVFIVRQLRRCLSQLLSLQLVRSTLEQHKWTYDTTAF
jgi:hypothetical protein